MQSFLPDWFPVIARDLGIIAAVLTAIGLIWKMLIKKIVDGAKRIEASLRFVEAELKPNGGSSLRDAVDRLEQQHGILQTRMDTIDQKLSAAKVRGF